MRGALTTVFIVAIGFAAQGARPAAAEGNRALPFWAQPYPYAYAYTHRPPPSHICLEWRTVDTFFGPRREQVPTCDQAVSAKY